MRRTKLFVWVLAVALLLCACTGRPNQNLPDGRSDLTKWVVSERQVEIPSQTVEHGEDYVIQWEDPAMEAHIRFVLNQPGRGHPAQRRVGDSGAADQRKRRGCRMDRAD